MKWFKHDSNAGSDAKLKRLKMRYGMEGYGLYWYCLEIISDKVDQNNYTFELDHDAEIISFDTGIHRDQVQEIMSYMVELELFENSNGMITCLKMAKRLDQSMTSNIELRKVITKIKYNHDSVMTKSEQKSVEEKTLDKNKKNIVISSPKSDPVPYQAIIDLYHEKLEALPKVAKLTSKRKAQIRQRWSTDIGTIEQWGFFFDHVADSDFLMGKKPPTNGRPAFRADIEWITNETNFAKIAENKYHI